MYVPPPGNVCVQPVWDSSETMYVPGLRLVNAYVPDSFTLGVPASSDAVTVLRCTGSPAKVVPSNLIVQPAKPAVAPSTSTPSASRSLNFRPLIDPGVKLPKSWPV